MSSCDKPFFLAIVNQQYTPGNQSAHITRNWFSGLVGGVNGHILDTSTMSKEVFVNTFSEVCKNHKILCLYVCVHGVQYREKDGTKEFLKINDRVEVPDYEFTALLNNLQFEQLYVFNESCHGAGLFNGIVLDKGETKLKNVVIFNACSKEEKCFVRIVYSQSIGLVSHLLFTSKINPFKSPETALSIVKHQYPDLQTTVTLLKNLN